MNDWLNKNGLDEFINEIKEQEPPSQQTYI